MLEVFLVLKFHYLNVGHGDSIIIEFGETGRTMMVDINRSSEFDEDTKNELVNIAYESVSPSSRMLHELGIKTTSELLTEAKYDIKLTDPLEYLQEHNISSIFRFISTHPHADHFTGLKKLFEIYRPTNFWVSKNNFDINESDLSENQKEDWWLYKKLRNTSDREVDGTIVINPRDGDSRDFWAQDNVTILAPSPELIETAEESDNKNLMSYVLLIEYGGRKILLGGDAEKETWQYIMENYFDKIENITILDASHHGRDSGFYAEAVSHMNPEFVLVSVGKKPKTDASNKYRRYSDNVWSTRWKGNIRFEINPDGTGHYFTQYER
jgi:beta-lactamase superfamily II metal-dependent hydrolase